VIKRKSTHEDENKIDSTPSHICKHDNNNNPIVLVE